MRGTKEGIHLQPISRRSFLVRGSAVAGAAAVGGGGIAALAASSGSDALTEEEIQALDQPVLVQVRDAEKGEVEILFGENEVVFTDKSLVAKVLRAAR